MDLFENIKTKHEPLAARMRPRNLDEYIGQEGIIGTGRLLRRAIQADQLTSVIFYGPPGTGKTTLAKVIANHTKSSFQSLNAVLSGIQQIREAISAAEEKRNLYQKKTILFVDEVHRWNKAQQDALLPWVENGTFILIGATTENPFFEVNRALVSRSRVFRLEPLKQDELYKIAWQAIKDKERGYGLYDVSFQEGALEHLVETASGDARSLLNALELAVETTPAKWPPAPGEKIFISMETAEESIQQKVVLYDKDGDYHYDVISAFIKSLRGRDPDGALYWMARMIAAGESPDFIFRRMLISAAEDTGLADPQAITVVESCAAAFDRVGLPEGRFFLTQAALYLSTCPKSNSSLAFFDALSAVEKENEEIPNHLKDGSRDSKQLGHGKGYLYPHSYHNHWVPQQYLPDSLTGRVFYKPSSQGYEDTIRKEVLSRKEAQIADLLNSKNTHTEEALAFSPGDTLKEEWIKRTERNVQDELILIKNHIFEMAAPKRTHRNLIVGADNGLYLWESLRKSPEGLTIGLCYYKSSPGILLEYSKFLEEMERPELYYLETWNEESINSFGDQREQGTKNLKFENIFLKDCLTSKWGLGKTPSEILRLFRGLSKEDTKVVFVQNLPAMGQKLSEICGNLKLKELEQVLSLCEKLVFGEASGSAYSWTEEKIKENLNSKKQSWTSETVTLVQNRSISGKDIETWFNKEKSTYGKAVFEILGNDMEKFTEIKNQIVKNLSGKSFQWKSTVGIFANKPGTINTQDTSL